MLKQVEEDPHHLVKMEARGGTGQETQGTVSGSKAETTLRAKANEPATSLSWTLGPTLGANGESCLRAIVALRLDFAIWKKQEHA